MGFGSGRDPESEMRQEAQRHAAPLRGGDRHAGAHGETPMERALRQYERDNPSRLRFLWRAWHFVFGRGIRVG
jgi:hypothetical protein